MTPESYHTRSTGLLHSIARRSNDRTIRVTVQLMNTKLESARLNVSHDELPHTISGSTQFERSQMVTTFWCPHVQCMVLYAYITGYLLNLLRCDVFTLRQLEDRLLAVNNLERTVGHPLADIARVQPAILIQHHIPGQC